MASILIEDLLVCETQDRMAMDTFFGGADPCCPSGSSRMLYEYHARDEAIGTFISDECEELVQRFQPVYIRVYEERGDTYQRSFIGPTCWTGEPEPCV